MIDRSKPLLWPELTKIGREPYRLQTILQIRNSIKPELVVLDSPDKRAELVIRYYMLTRCNPLAALVTRDNA